MIIRKYEQMKRYRQIILVLVKHGFGTFMDQLGVLKHLNIKWHKSLQDTAKLNTPQSIGRRLRESFEELGTTFVKLGQLLSTRKDLLPEEIISELEELQYGVKPFPFAEVKELIESELGDTLENLFTEFKSTPIAGASIAQVHVARLPSGEQVVVKVQRPGIQTAIKQDITILQDLAHWVDSYTKYGKLYSFSRIVTEFADILRQELDFQIEGENAEKFKRNFAAQTGIKVPLIYWQKTSQRILTMEYINGYRLSELEMMTNQGFSPKLIARRISDAILHQILQDGFFHGDPHPGNLMILPDETVVFLDLGMVGRINEERKNLLVRMMLGVVFKNSRLLVQAILELDPTAPRINVKVLEKEINRLRDKYLAVPLPQIKMGQVFQEIFRIAFSYQIFIPEEFALLAKTLVILEGVVEKLDPSLSIMELAEPLSKKLIFEVYSPASIGKEMYGSLVDYGSLFKELPGYLINLLSKSDNDELTIQLKIKDIDRLEQRTDGMINRLSFSVILLAVSIIIAAILISSSLNASGPAVNYSLNLNFLRISLVIAGIVIVGLIISIFRSRW